MNLKVLRYDTQEKVAIVTMNHPPINELGLPFLFDFEAVLDEIRATKMRAMVITSSCPGFFSAGDDVKKMKDFDPTFFDHHERVHALLDAIETLPIPTIAAINGRAFGGGMELAMTCDFRFMGDDSGRLGLPEARLGLIPAFGGTQRLTQLVGKAKAIEMIYHGLMIKPEDADRIGLITAVHPQEEVVAKSIEYALHLSRKAIDTIGRIKHCINVGLREGFDRGLQAELNACKENLGTPDAQEGVAAYLEGRVPRFGQE